jgi:hypothetical protein
MACCTGQPALLAAGRRSPLEMSHAVRAVVAGLSAILGNVYVDTVDPSLTGSLRWETAVNSRAVQNLDHLEEFNLGQIDHEGVSLVPCGALRAGDQSAGGPARCTLQTKLSPSDGDWGTH